MPRRRTDWNDVRDGESFSSEHVLHDDLHSQHGTTTTEHHALQLHHQNMLHKQSQGAHTSGKKCSMKEWKWHTIKAQITPSNRAIMCCCAVGRFSSLISCFSPPFKNNWPYWSILHFQKQLDVMACFEDEAGCMGQAKLAMPLQQNSLASRKTMFHQIQQDSFWLHLYLLHLVSECNNVGSNVKGMSILASVQLSPCNNWKVMSDDEWRASVSSCYHHVA